MAGISPKLPLSLDKTDLGDSLNRTLRQSIQQNLVHLILTNPGEKVMDSRFGVGIKKYLFNNFSQSASDSIVNGIKSQVMKYMPFLAIEEIKIIESQDYNTLSLFIKYSVPTLSIQDVLNLNIPYGETTYKLGGNILETYDTND